MRSKRARALERTSSSSATNSTLLFRKLKTWLYNLIILVYMLLSPHSFSPCLAGPLCASFTFTFVHLFPSWLLYFSSALPIKSKSMLWFRIRKRPHWNERASERYVCMYLLWTSAYFVMLNWFRYVFSLILYLFWLLHRMLMKLVLESIASQAREPRDRANNTKW